MKNTLTLLVLGAILLIPSYSSAADIENLQVKRVGSQLIMTWNALSGNNYGAAEGYAVSWGQMQSDLRIDKYARQHLGNVTSFGIRGADFKRNENYYFRVFSYKQESTYKHKLLKGSQILKWKETGYDQYETQLLSANDPVIVATTVDDSGNEVNVSFGPLTAMPMDTFIDIRWTNHVGLTKDDFDKIHLELSKDAGFTTIAGSIAVDRGKIRARAEGLAPSTQYYVRASFQKDGTDFSTTGGKAVKTIQSIRRDGKSRASRNIMKLEKRPIDSFNLGETPTISTSNSDTTSSLTSVDSNVINSSNKLSIQQRITQVESQISSLQAELRSLRSKLGNRTISRTPVRSRISSSNRSSGRISIQERLKARLSKLRNR